MTKPDITSTVNYHTFKDENLYAALRRAVDFLEENNIDDIDDNDTIVYEYSDVDNLWFVSIHGEYRVNKSLDDFEEL